MIVKKKIDLAEVVKNPTELAQELAYRARDLRRLAVRQLEDEPEEGPLRNLYNAFKGALVHDQTEDEFADAFAQTITYGLLTARWTGNDDLIASGERLTRQTAYKYLAAASPFLNDLFRSALAVKLDEKRGRLLWLVDDIADLLDRIDITYVFGIGDEESDTATDPVIHFYEPFLAAYDANQRRDRGVYYTPDAVVRYMVATSNATLIQRAPQGHGLASGDVRVVDPATGTGTFLREVIRFASVHSKVEADVWKVVESLRGLETMVVPYAICHLRLALALRELLPSQEKAQTVRVHLTDTLEPAAEPPPELFRDSAALAREAVAAKSVKDERSWTLVIGNPPYKNNSDYTLAQIAERFPSLLESSRQAAAAQVRNIRDDYAWFFAAADSFTVSGGAICFVTSDSYLKKSSYRHFRQELIRRYDIVRITRLGSGVFLNVGPRIGFAVILMVRRDRPLPSTDVADPISLIDISSLATEMSPRDRGTPKDPRLVWLAEAADNDAKALRKSGIRESSVRPCEQNEFRFVGEGDSNTSRSMRRQIVAKKGSGFISIFVKKWPGIITAFDCLLKAESADVLAKRMKQFFGAAVSQRASDIDALATECGCTDTQKERLVFLCEDARRNRLRFDRNRIEPVFAGSIPDGLDWHPPLKYAHWVYYEPGIKVPRNVNPGKAVGWGTMNQWQDPRCHGTFPKLIFTTSTNRKYGFRAYVVDSGWFTKLHGAASQQYSFVTLTNPTTSARLNGEPNNLTGEGEKLLALLRSWGHEDVDLLHSIAAFYNSSYAREYILREEESMLPLPTISIEDRAQVSKIIGLARELRELRTAEEWGNSSEDFPVQELQKKRRSGSTLIQGLDRKRAELNRIVEGLVGPGNDTEDD